MNTFIFATVVGAIVSIALVFSIVSVLEKMGVFFADADDQVLAPPSLTSGEIISSSIFVKVALAKDSKASLEMRFSRLDSALIAEEARTLKTATQPSTPYRTNVSNKAPSTRSFVSVLA